MVLTCKEVAMPYSSIFLSELSSIEVMCGINGDEVL